MDMLIACKACGRNNSLQRRVCLYCRADPQTGEQANARASEDSTKEKSVEISLMSEPRRGGIEISGNDITQPVALIGSILLFIGVFCPFISVPILGGVNYFQSGRSLGTIVALLAVTAFIFTLRQDYKLLLSSAIGGLGLTAFSLVQFQIRVSQGRAEIAKDMAGNPFSGMADAAMKAIQQSVQIQWGAALLVVGAGLIIAAVLMKEGVSIFGEAYRTVCATLSEKRSVLRSGSFRAAAAAGSILLITVFFYWHWISSPKYSLQQAWKAVETLSLPPTVGQFLT